MTKYFEKISKRIAANTRKYTSLQEYKNIILANKDQIDPELLEERMEQIDLEFEKLKKSIHANKKAQAHYNAAFNHLVDLRSLDNKLQLVTDVNERESLEAEIIEHTQKLQKHLSILPEQLVNEIQQKYLEYVENNPLVVETPQDTSVEPEIQPVEETSNVENEELYTELLNLFEQEKNVFAQVKYFQTIEEFESFLERYKELKLECYKQFINTEVNTEENITAAEVSSTEDTPVEESTENNLVDENTMDISTEEESEVEQTPTEEAPVEQEPKTPETIMAELVENIEAPEKVTQKLSPANVKISNGFKDELKSGKWLYNVVHYAAELTNVSNVSNEEFIKNVSSIEKNNARMTVLKERIATLSETNAKDVYNEYYNGNNDKRLTTALKVLLEGKVNQLA